MAFCTNCGSGLSDDARFCTNCGQPTAMAAGGAAMPVSVAAPVPVPASSLQKLTYEIQGSNLQIARVYLKAGEEVYAEAGRMIYKTPNVQWDTRMSGNSIADKLWGAIKRKMMGESLFLTYFRALSDGEVGFAGSYPGKIQIFDLRAGQSVMVQRDSFLFAQTTVQLNIALVKKLRAGFFGGEGFILEKLTGPGSVFIHGGGDFVEFTLKPGEVLQVDSGCIVAFEEGVGYDIQMVGGIKSALFGGEGLFLATLTGPGKVVVQSMTLEKMRRELAPMRTGGDEHRGLDVLGGIFDNEN